MRAVLRLQFIILFCLLLNTSLNSQWVRVANPQELPSGWQAMAIDACDSNTVAFVVFNWQGAEQIVRLVKTTDGGNSWQIFSTPAKQAGADISIRDKYNIWFATLDGKIYNSANGGVNWNVEFDDTLKTQSMNFIKMFDLNNGFAMGDCPVTRPDGSGGLEYPGPATFLKTTNGGRTWNALNVTAFGGISGDLWRRLDFPSMNIGYFFESGLNPQYIYKTQMGGAKWAKLANFNSYAQVVKFYDEFLGLVVNLDNIYRTKDGGYTWENFKLPVSGWGSDIEFIPGDASKLWVINNKGAYFSSDTGKTFKEYKLLTAGIIPRDIVFTDKNHGWLYCDQGVLFKTDNLTKITDVNENTKAVREYSLSQNYPNPFNPSTTISYSIAEGGFVKMKVYDILGNELATLVNDYRPAGNQSVSFNAASLPSGVYIYRIEAGDFRDAKKLLYLK